MARIAAVLVALACSAGCRQIFGIEPVHSDAAGDAGGGGGGDGRGDALDAGEDGNPGVAGPLSASPDVDVVLVTGMGSASTIVKVTNPGSQTYAIASFERDATCATTDPSSTSIVLTSSATLPPQASTLVMAACDGNVGTFAGMQRCLYHGVDASNHDLVDFMMVCEYASTGALSGSPPALDFGNVAVGSTSASMGTLIADMSASPATGLAIQIDDLAGNFVVSTPCATSPGISCDAAGLVITTGSTTPIALQCTPHTTGMHTANVYVASKNLYFLGASGQSTIALSCTGT